MVPVPPIMVAFISDGSKGFIGFFFFLPNPNIPNLLFIRLSGLFLKFNSVSYHYNTNQKYNNAD